MKFSKRFVALMLVLAMFIPTVEVRADNVVVLPDGSIRDFDKNIITFPDGTVYDFEKNSVTLPDGTVIDNINWVEYDENGNIISMNDDDNDNTNNNDNTNYEDEEDDYDIDEDEEDDEKDSIDMAALDKYYEADTYSEYEEQYDAYKALYERCKKQATTTKDGYVIYKDILLDYVGKSSELTIPSSVKKIYGFNVSGYEGVKKVTIPSSVTDIRHSFYGGKSERKIIFAKRNGNPLRIGNNCFHFLYDPPILPKETTYIGYDCFCNCNLVNFQIPEAITTIKEGSFSDFKEIFLTIPDSVTTLEDRTFSGIDSVSEKGYTIKVPASVKKIGKSCLMLKDSIGGVVCKKGSAAAKYCKKAHIPYTTNPKIAFQKKTYYICKGTTDFVPFYVWDDSSKVKYTSKNSAIAQSKNGVENGITIKGKKEEKTTVTAKYGGKSYRVNIVVLKSTVNNRVKQGVHNTLRSGMTKYEKAIALYEWLFDQCRYDFDTVFGGNSKRKYSAYSAEGALLEGSAVCEGYAEACKLLFDKAGLQNQIIHGSVNGMGHAWNLVKVEGGWMHVDVANRIIGSDKQAKECGLIWNASSYPKANAKYRG